MFINVNRDKFLYKRDNLNLGTKVVFIQVEMYIFLRNIIIESMHLGNETQ